jgi:lactoylglutathione lyase
MRLEHIAVWTSDLERMKQFYERWFGAVAGPKYTNERKGFASYFLAFESGARLEIMQKSGVAPRPGAVEQEWLGYAHLAFDVGSEEAVDALAASFQAAGHTVFDGPRRTGDGCYEAVILDPDGNRVEITA